MDVIQTGSAGPREALPQERGSEEDKATTEDTTEPATGCEESCVCVCVGELDALYEDGETPRAGLSLVGAQFPHISVGRGPDSATRLLSSPLWVSRGPAACPECAFHLQKEDNEKRTERKVRTTHTV